MNSKKPTVFQPIDKPFFWTMLRTEIIQHMLNKTPLWSIYKRNWLFKRLVAEIDGKPFLICSPVHFQQGKDMFADVGNYTYTIDDVKETLLRPKGIVEPDEVFAFMDVMKPNRENAFLFRLKMKSHGA